MKKLIVIAMSLISMGSMAQDHGNPVMCKKLSALDQLVGDWEGEGYIIDQRTREKKTFIQIEEMRYDLDSTIIAIKGVGKSDGKIVHDARAIIRPSDTSDHFEFYSFLADGRTGKFLMEKEENIIKWYIDVPQGQLRYTITIKGDSYHEIGEFGAGGQWYPFMEMNLKKVM